MPQNQKSLIISILVAAVLIAGSIFYYTINVKKYNSSNNLTNQNQEASKTASVIDARKVDISNEFFLGNENAPVTIIEYSSYFCGHCIAFHKEKLPLLKKDYIDTGKVKFIDRAFPAELAQAVFCAGEQNKYWDFSNYLFENTQELVDKIKTVNDISSTTEDIAKKLGLDEKKFADCYASGKYQNKLQQWNNDAQAAQVEGTPTFFINGKKIVGNQPYEVFKAAIDPYTH